MAQRDDFYKDTKRELRERVAGKCSKPDCGIETQGPSKTGSKDLNVGKAAHICAASVGGPRFDSKMTPSQRKNTDNGIWLCSNCADLIDKDAETYPVALLHEWKKNAEEKAHNNRGKKLYDQKEINEQRTKELVTVMTGVPAHASSELVRNVIDAHSQGLELLDNRFKITTSYVDGAPHVEIRAKEKVNVTMHIEKSYINEFSEKKDKLHSHGEELEISSEAISFTGSKLFEELFNKEKGRLVLSPKRVIDCVMKAQLVNKKNGHAVPVDDFYGDISVGSKRFTFHGSIFGGLIEIKVELSHENMKINGMNFSLLFNHSIWEGIEISRLPYFDRSLELFRLLVDADYQFDMKLFHQGRFICSGHSNDMSNMKELTQVKNTLEYIDACNIVAQYLKKSIVYPAEFSYSLDDAKDIFNIKTIISAGGQKIIDCNKEVVKMEAAAVFSDAIKNLLEDKNPTDMTMNQKIPIKLNLLGVDCDSPLISFKLTHAVPEIDADLSSLQVGDPVNLKWIPSENSQVIMEIIDG